MRSLVMRCMVLAAAAALTLLTLSCGGGGAQDVSNTLQPAPSASATTPATDGPASETPSDKGFGTDQATWLARADNICQLAISTYHQRKAEIGTDSPEALAVAAAAVTRTASNALAELAAPTAEAEQMTAQVRDFAEGEQAMASAMVSGSYSDVNTAGDKLDAAARNLAATAGAVGAQQCAAMTDEV